MPHAKWRPASEADATTTCAALLEWLRAVRCIALAGADGLAAWRARAPADFAAAIADFVGLDGAADVRQTLLRGHDAREALILHGNSWQRAELRTAPALPAEVATMLAALTQADLPALAASHLLDADTRPDTLLHWGGDPAEPWPLGAWLVGATVVLGSADPHVRAAPAWRGASAQAASLASGCTANAASV